MNHDTEAAMRHLYGVYDRGGYIVLTDFVHLMDELGSSLALDAVQRLAREIGQDGMIEWEAFASAASRGALGDVSAYARLFKGEQQLAAKVRVLFERWDQDGDGALSLGDLEFGLASMGQQLSRDELGTIMAALDVNGNGVVSFDEFLHGMSSSDVLGSAFLHAPEAAAPPAAPATPSASSSAGRAAPKTPGGHHVGAETMEELYMLRRGAQSHERTVTALHAEIADLRAEAERAAALEAELQRARSAAAKHRATTIQLSEVQQQLSEARDDNEHMSAELRAVRSAHASLQRERDAAVEACGDARDTLMEAQNEADALRHSLRAARHEQTSARALEERLHRLQEEYHASLAEAEALREQHGAAEEWQHDKVALLAALEAERSGHEAMRARVGELETAVDELKMEAAQPHTPSATAGAGSLFAEIMAANMDESMDSSVDGESDGDDDGDDEREADGDGDESDGEEEATVATPPPPPGHEASAPPPQGEETPTADSPQRKGKRGSLVLLSSPKRQDSMRMLRALDEARAEAQAAAESRREVAQLHGELQEMRASAATLQRQLDERTAAAAELQRSLDEARAAGEQHRGAAAAAVRALADARAVHAGEGAEWAQRVASADADAAAQRTRCSELLATAERLKEQAAAANADAADAHRQVARLHTQLQHEEATVRRLQRLQEAQARAAAAPSTPARTRAATVHVKAPVPSAAAAPRSASAFERKMQALHDLLQRKKLVDPIQRREERARAQRMLELLLERSKYAPQTM